MSRTVHCVYLDRDAEGLPRKPLPGELGERIYNEISAEAFKRGLLAETAGADDQVMKFLAPLTISEAELNQGLDILDEAVDSAAAARKG